jgi:hypothetical protein
MVGKPDRRAGVGGRWRGNDCGNAVVDCGYRSDLIRSLRRGHRAGSRVCTDHWAEHWNGNQFGHGRHWRERPR